MTDPAQLALATRIQHPSYRAPDGFAAFPQAIHHASTVLFENVAHMRSVDWLDKTGYTYGLHGTPTTFSLEAQLASIEGGTYCSLAPSGLAAIALIDFAFLNTGDDVLLPDNAYNPNRDLGRWLTRDFGISVRIYDPLIGAGIADLILPNTKLIWTEAPGSVTMEMPDIPAICAQAKARSVLVALDNTWAAGLAFNGFAHGVDIVMQALTKYQSGGSDVLMGAVITQNKSLAQKIDLTHMRLGYGVGADDAYLVLRGLSSMKLRFEAQDRSARKLAEWLKNRPEVVRVLHPALPDSPGHEVWQRDFTGAASLFSIILDAKFPESATDLVVDSLKLFKIGFSWGGAHSLCVPYRVAEMRNNWQEKGQLLRFYVGLEDIDDLIADVAQALDKLK